MPPKGKQSKTPTGGPVTSAADDAAALAAADPNAASKLVQLRLSAIEPKFKNAPPRGRAFHCGCYDDSRIVCFGGWDGAVFEHGPAKRHPLPTVEYCVPLMEWTVVGSGSQLAGTSLSATTRALHMSNSALQRMPNEHPAATQAAASESNGTLYVHGGWNGINRCSTLSALCLMEYKWSTLPLTGDVRIPALTFHTLNAVGKKLCVYGGNTDGTLEVVPAQPAAPVDPKAPAAAAPAATVNQVVNTINGDMYIIDLGNGNSVSLGATLGAPPRRSSHTATVLLDTYILVFGGRGGADGTTVLGDVALFDTSSSNWILNVKVEGSSAAPCARYGHAACRIEGKGVFIHGGVSAEGDLLGDAWLLSMEKPGTITWKRVLSEGTLLTPRCGHLMFNLPNSHQVFVVGGRHRLSSSLIPTQGTTHSYTGMASNAADLLAAETTSQQRESHRGNGRVSPVSAAGGSSKVDKHNSQQSGPTQSSSSAAVSEPLDYIVVDFPDLRPPGTKTPSTSSLQGGGHRESTSSKLNSVRPHQPLQLN